MRKPKANRRRVPGKPDAGNPPVRFDEGWRDASETDNSGRFKSQPRLSAHSTNLSAVAYETRSHIGASPIRGVKLFIPEESVQRRNREAKASTMAFSNNSAATTVIRIK
jgi:hypothetical protein